MKNRFHDETTQVEIFRSPKKPGLYLYLQAGSALDQLPSDLMSRFGQPQFAFEIPLCLETTLVHADPECVLESLETQGYYLQLPPTVEE